MRDVAGETAFALDRVPQASHPDLQCTDEGRQFARHVRPGRRRRIRIQALDHASGAVEEAECRTHLPQAQRDHDGQREGDAHRQHRVHAALHRVPALALGADHQRPMRARAIMCRTRQQAPGMSIGQACIEVTRQCRIARSGRQGDPAAVRRGQQHLAARAVHGEELRVPVFLVVGQRDVHAMALHRQRDDVGAQRQPLVEMRVDLAVDEHVQQHEQQGQHGARAEGHAPRQPTAQRPGACVRRGVHGMQYPKPRRVSIGLPAPARASLPRRVLTITSTTLSEASLALS